MSPLLLLTAFLVVAYADDARMFYYHSIDKLGNAVNLTCVEGGATNNTVLHWVLEDNMVIDLNTTGIKHMSLSSDMSSLHIPSVDENLLGTYLCSMITPRGDRVYSRTKLYLYKESLWNTYRKNVYVGLIAAGVCLIAMSTLCALSTHRWTEAEKGGGTEEVEVGPVETKTGGEVLPMHGHHNSGFDMDRNEAGLHKDKGDAETCSCDRVVQEDEVNNGHMEKRMWMVNDDQQDKRKLKWT